MRARTAVLSAMMLMAMWVFQAAPSQASPLNTVAAQEVVAARVDPEVTAAMRAAVNGDTSSLERLLASPKAAEMQAAVQKWVLTHPAPEPDITNPSATQSAPPVVTLTGEYDYYCTGYNGVTIGWNGKTFHACHGYLDKYISGSRVGHYIPDAYPAGNPVSVACAHAYIGGAVFALGVLAAGVPTGGLGWSALFVGTGWAAEEIWISCGRVY